MLLVSSILMAEQNYFIYNWNNTLETPDNTCSVSVV